MVGTAAGTIRPKGGTSRPGNETRAPANRPAPAETNWLWNAFLELLEHLVVVLERNHTPR